MRTSLTIPARTEKWNDLREILSEHLAGFGVPREVIEDMVLVSEEVFVNAVTHGGSGPNGPPVRILIKVEEETLTLRFEDAGKAFDPLSVPAPDLDGPTEERAIGGLGVYLMGELTDRMSYERADNRNILTLERRLTR